MRAFTATSLLLLVAFAISDLVGQDRAPLQAQPPVQIQKTAISADELNSKYEVRGPLGEPLGKVLTVVAEPIELLEKGADPSLLVRSISGTPLQRPVVMPFQLWRWANVKRLEKGVSYELRVFQDGGFSGTPQQAMAETVPIQSAGYHFKTHLVVVNSLKQLPPAQQRPAR